VKNIIITSTQPRHNYYAGMLCENINIDYIIWEDKPESGGVFKDFNNKEKLKFDKYLDFKFKCPQLNLKKGEINNPPTIDRIKDINPDIIFVFGSSLLKPEVFNLAKKGCINIHTSLVQYFRGVDSSFWAIHDERPEAIGATLHFINNTIDAGDIIDQKQASLSIDDNLDDLFLKSCECGFNMLLDNLKDIVNQKTKTKSLSKLGKLYTLKDMNNHVKQIAQDKTFDVLKKYIK
jgi:methionyl-tRNA formyltransferase